MYRQFLVSHFNPAFELLVVLIVYANFASDGYFLETFSVFLLAGGLLWTPVMFNPNALDFTYARLVKYLCVPLRAAICTAKRSFTTIFYFIVERSGQVSLNAHTLCLTLSPQTRRLDSTSCPNSILRPLPKNAIQAQKCKTPLFLVMEMF